MRNYLATLTAALILSSAPLFAHAESGGGPTVDAVRLNRSGVALLEAKNFTEAQDHFLKGLREAPLWAPLHVNLGLTYYGLGQMEKAQASYETALKLSADPQVSFIVKYNLGELAGKAKDVPKALKFYQEALDLKPDSRETKVNIELLTQQNGGGGGGEGEDKDKDKKDGKDNKDKKDGKGDKPDDKKDDKDKDKGKEYQSEKENKKKQQPQKFKSEDLTQGDVNKILGEIKQQEQKIRQDYNKKDMKEKARDKDW